MQQINIIDFRDCYFYCLLPNKDKNRVPLVGTWYCKSLSYITHSQYCIFFASLHFFVSQKKEWKMRTIYKLSLISSDEMVIFFFEPSIVVCRLWENLSWCLCRAPNVICSSKDPANIITLIDTTHITKPRDRLYYFGCKKFIRGGWLCSLSFRSLVFN